jgi:hypothetical protein
VGIIENWVSLIVEDWVGAVTDAVIVVIGGVMQCVSFVKVHFNDI